MNTPETVAAAGHTASPTVTDIVKAAGRIFCIIWELTCRKIINTAHARNAAEKTVSDSMIKTGKERGSVITAVMVTGWI